MTIHVFYECAILVIDMYCLLKSTMNIEGEGYGI